MRRPPGIPRGRRAPAPPGARAGTNVRPARPQQKDIRRPEKQEFLWPITVHWLDGTPVDTSLITPDPFAVLAVQIDRAKEHLSGPSSSREGR